MSGLQSIQLFVLSHPLVGGPAHPLSTRWSSMTAGGSGAPAKAAVGGGGGSSASASASGGSATPAFLFPLPHDYEQALQRKLGMTNDMRNKFKQVHN